MEFKKIFSLGAAILFGFIIFSCTLDPRVTEKTSTDVVTIAKTTRAFSKENSAAIARKGQVGAVKMSHKVHEDKGLKCIDCHHKKIKGKNANPDREKKCAVCHYGDNGYETMHGLCVDCHIAKKEGPQRCKECH